MADQIFKQPQRPLQEQPQTQELPQAQNQKQTFNVAGLLADIDSLLETNAQSFVQGFVQKGGQ
ncbi:ubiquitin-like protein Pup [Arcanobacterium hippocoleae]